jgi:hypothetical protein
VAAEVGPVIARFAAAASLLAALVAGGDGLAAQPGEVRTLLPLPPGHWAAAVAVRLEALGLAPGHQLAEGEPGRAEFEALLREAEARAAGMGPGVAGLVEGWRRRWDAEPATDGAGGGGAVGARLGLRQGRPAARGLPPSASTEAPLGGPEVGDGPAVVGWAAVAAGGWGSLAVEPGLGAGGLRLVTADAAVAWRNLRLSAGRGQVRYGADGESAVALRTGAPFDRIEARSRAPFRLPGVLGAAGTVTVHTALGVHPDRERFSRPVYLWAFRASARPHGRLTVAANRAALFGGPAADGRITLRDFLRVAAGAYHPDGSSFENQNGSLQVRYRPPTERTVPLLVHVEWGADDAAGGLDEAPGVVAGLRIPAVPGLPALGVGGEFAWFGVRCCRPEGLRWYLHKHLAWAAGGQPMGHPLGGNGREWRVHGSGSFLDARVRTDARLMLRTREALTLYGPERAGRSRAGALVLELVPSRRLELALRGSGEWGRGWRTRSLAAELGVLF